MTVTIRYEQRVVYFIKETLFLFHCSVTAVVLKSNKSVFAHLVLSIFVFILTYMCE